MSITVVQLHLSLGENRGDYCDTNDNKREAWSLNDTDDKVSGHEWPSTYC